MLFFIAFYSVLYFEEIWGWNARRQHAIGVKGIGNPWQGKKDRTFKKR
jgi:hypothetical protein